jgi:outer membrane murein-binding lipoprotein Lpp
MTRLHIQVNQTIQFYRGQQGGTAPQRLFLSGGASIMAYTSQFFAEKLNIPVEYFNPFRNIQIDPSINIEELAAVAHSFGEVVGLGLRNLAHCPVELNLMPKSSIKRQEFNQKKPYLIASIFSLVLVVSAIALFFSKIAEQHANAAAQLTAQTAPLTAKSQQIRTAVSAADDAKTAANEYLDLTKYRYYYAEILAELRRCLIATEQKQKAAMEADFKKNGEDRKADAGLWIETFTPRLPAGSGYFVGGDSVVSVKRSAAYIKRYKIKEDKNREAGTAMVTIECQVRAVNLRPISREYNSDLLYKLQDELLAGGFFVNDTNGPIIGPIAVPPDVAGSDPAKPPVPALTFTFPLNLKLKRPLKM